MTVFNLILFVFSAGILYVIVRYRVHVHVTYEPIPRMRRNPRRLRESQAQAEMVARAAAETAKGCRATGADSVTRDEEILRLTLQELGASKKQAKTAASRAIAKHPAAAFEELLRAAIQESSTVA